MVADHLVALGRNVAGDGGDELRGGMHLEIVVNYRKRLTTKVVRSSTIGGMRYHPAKSVKGKQNGNFAVLFMQR
jgi:hypothetical protein